jgi:hypothetical protein
MAKKNDTVGTKGATVKSGDIINQHKRMAMGLPIEPMSKMPVKKTPA